MQGNQQELLNSTAAKLRAVKLSTKIFPENEVTLSSLNYDSRPINRYFVIKIRRSTVLAFFISLLIHGIVLFAFYPKKITEGSSVAHSRPQSISVSLAGLPPRKPLEAVMPTKPKAPPPVLAVEKKAALASPQATFTTLQPSENGAPKDFMSLIKAKRQRAQELEDYAARENANARAPSADEQRDENINRNLQQKGTSGIFELKHISDRTAQFSFKGWKNDYSIPHLEVIDVTAGADGDIDLAVVKKMIEIIRREYNGDFNWESQRLGRIIVLSARMSDNDGLEAFLKQEFFSANRF